MVSLDNRADMYCESVLRLICKVKLALWGCLPDRGRRRRLSVSKAIKSARVIAFADLGMEAIHAFDVEDMPVTFAIDSRGSSIHGPKARRENMPQPPH